MKTDKKRPRAVGRVRPNYCIRRLREELGLSQEDFGKLLGRSRETAKGLEQGRFSLSEEFAWEIALRFDIHPGWLFDNDENAPILDRSGKPWDSTNPIAALDGWNNASVEKSRDPHVHRLHMAADEIRTRADLAHIAADLHGIFAANYGQPIRMTKLQIRMRKFVDDLKSEFGFDESVHASHRSEIDAAEKQRLKEEQALEPQRDEIHQAIHRQYAILEQHDNQHVTDENFQSKSLRLKWRRGEISLEEGVALAKAAEPGRILSVP